MSDLNKIREQLSAYVDGELNDRERAAVEQALEREPSLRAEVEQLRAIRKLVKATPRAAAPADFVSRVMAQVERKSLVTGHAAADDDGRWGRFARHFATAAMVLVALGILMVVAVTMYFTPAVDRNVAVNVKPGAPANNEKVASRDESDKLRKDGLDHGTYTKGGALGGGGNSVDRPTDTDQPVMMVVFADDVAAALRDVDAAMTAASLDGKAKKSNDDHAGPQPEMKGGKEHEDAAGWQACRGGYRMRATLSNEQFAAVEKALKSLDTVSLPERMEVAKVAGGAARGMPGGRAADPSQGTGEVGGKSAGKVNEKMDYGKPESVACKPDTEKLKDFAGETPLATRAGVAPGKALPEGDAKNLEVRGQEQTVRQRDLIVLVMPAKSPMAKMQPDELQSLTKEAMCAAAKDAKEGGPSGDADGCGPVSKPPMPAVPAGPAEHRPLVAGSKAGEPTTRAASSPNTKPATAAAEK